MQELLNFDLAYRKFIDKLISSGFVIKNIIPINQNRYMIIKTETENFLFLFKREPLYTYEAMFPDRKGEGFGESINSVDFEIAMSHNVSRIFSCYENNNLYSIELKEFLKDGKLWTNSEREVVSLGLGRFKFEGKL